MRRWRKIKIKPISQRAKYRAKNAQLQAAFYAELARRPQEPRTRREWNQMRAADIYAEARKLMRIDG